MSILSEKPGGKDSSLVTKPGLGNIGQSTIESGGELRQILAMPGIHFATLLLVPALIALSVSIYLSYAALTSSEVAGCSGGTLFDCSHVLHSKYSKWLGMPVSALAALTYLVMVSALAVTMYAKTDGMARRISWSVVAVCGLSAGLAALWFIVVQVFLIQHLCKYCLTAHACGLLIAGAILWKRPLGFRATILFSGMAALGISVLIIAQLLASEPPKFEIETFDMVAPAETDNTEKDDSLFSPPGIEEDEEDSTIFESPLFESPIGMSTAGDSRPLVAQLMTGMTASWSTSMLSYDPLQEDEDEEAQEEEKRLVNINGGATQLDPAVWPLIGDPNARHIFVEMYDYACPHCRNTHRAIKGACDSLGEDLAIILLPVPLNTRCNDAISSTGSHFHESCELAKLAVACWLVDREQFEVFHHWLFEGTHCPNYATAKAKAMELMGQEEIEAELAKTTASRFVQAHVDLYKRVGRGNVPKLMFPTTSIVGEYTSTNSLVDRIVRETR
ncbi:MAG: vitamin K epoxide reductase family protein [Pirellulaceae bacterium]